MSISEYRKTPMFLMFQAWDTNRPSYPNETDPRVVYAQSIKTNCRDIRAALNQLPYNQRAMYKIDPDYYTLVFTAASDLRHIRTTEGGKPDDLSVELRVPITGSSINVVIDICTIQNPTGGRNFEFSPNPSYAVLPEFRQDKKLVQMKTADYLDLKRLTGTIRKHVLSL